MSGSGNGGGKVDWGVLIHSSAGIIALVLGGLMYSQPWALPLFAGLMILSAVSAVWISWALDAWVPGHWLAMLPVVGVIIGIAGADWGHTLGGISWGYTLAYVCLWIAFGHFVIRGWQKMRAEAAGGAEGD